MKSPNGLIYLLAFFITLALISALVYVAHLPIDIRNDAALIALAEGLGFAIFWWFKRKK